jgi:hypothetical protein
LGNTLAASMGIDWKGLCNVSYTWRRASNVAQPPSFIHTFAANCIPGIGKDRMLYLYGSYSLINSAENDNHGKMATMLAFGSTTLPNKQTLSLSVTGMGQWYPSQSIEHPMPVMDVDDVTKAADGTVVHYYRDRPSDTIPPTNPVRTLAEYLSNADTIPIREFYPGTNYIVSCDFDYSVPLPWRLTGSLGAGYLLQKFAQPYEWYTITPQTSDDYSDWEILYFYVPDTLYAARNRKDGELYFDLKPHTASGSIVDIFSAGPFDITRHTKIRADQTLSARLSLSRDFGRPGNLRLTYQIAKTFSSLSQDAPVKIPVWSQILSFRWTVNLSFR